MYNNYNPYVYQPTQRFQQPVPSQMSVPLEQPQYIQPQFTKPTGLQGKQVDSVDVVKATDVPFDGTISYFPLTDNSAIVTKQLQTDGTSKIVIFKPVNEQKDENKYITKDDLKTALNDINIDELEDIRDEIKDIRKEIKEMKKK